MITLRDQRVILSNHVAELYGVETHEVNQAIKNNLEKFPRRISLGVGRRRNFSFKVENFDLKESRSRAALQVPSQSFYRERPLYAGHYLKSPKAVETTIAFVEAYAKLRELSRVMTEIPRQEENDEEVRQLREEVAELKRKLQQQG